MMCGKVSEHLLFIEKNGEKWKKELEKEEKQENGKSRKADKIRRYHICGKMEKNQENERIIIDEMAFYAYNKIRCLKNNMSIFIYKVSCLRRWNFNENDIPTKKEI